MPLPRGVQVVRKGGRTYYYYAPGRGTRKAGKRVSLGTELLSADIRRAMGETIPKAGTFDALIAAYKDSPEWDKLRPASQRDYDIALRKISAGAGDRAVAAMTAINVYQLRDDLAGTPVTANHTLSVLRTLIKWGVRRGYRPDNPVIGIERLPIDGDGARPWPEEGYQFVLEKAPERFKRMTFLGRATGQRASDLVRMCPAHLIADGIDVKVSKRRDKPHFVPLTAAQMIEIRSWDAKDLEPFIVSAIGNKMSGNHLGVDWNRWRASDEAKPIRHLRMTIHGLKATAVADRRAAGASDGSVADELGMSEAMVRRYSRFADKAASARASRDRREFENSAVALKKR